MGSDPGIYCFSEIWALALFGCDVVRGTGVFNAGDGWRVRLAFLIFLCGEEKGLCDTTSIDINFDGRLCMC